MSLDKRISFLESVIQAISTSLIKDIKNIGKGMGALAASRSFGIFFANVITGVLYVVNPFYSYAYAAIVSVVAGGIIPHTGKNFKTYTKEEKA